MKKIIIFTLLALFNFSCQRGCESMEKQWQTSERVYHIEQFSGGKVVKTYDFVGILNDSQGSDGYYFTVKDTLFEISGDISIKSWKKK